MREHYQRRQQDAGAKDFLEFHACVSIGCWEIFTDRRARPMRTATAQIVRTPLHEEVTNRIRDMIVESRLVPGERIQEMQLAQQLGVSRTPIREALKVLTSEGLVELLPLRGAIVKAFTGKDARDMLDVIAWLEAFAGERACQAEQPRIDAILAMHAHMEELYARRQRLEYFVLNQELHGTTVRLDPMPAASALSRLTATSSVEHPVVDVLIEVPRGSF
ncbi:MAG: GntR family transcriptional regulator, partial [Burkholderiaceae bacterium]